MEQKTSSSNLASSEAKKKPPRRQAEVTEKLQNERWGGGLPFPHPAEIHGNSPRGSILTADVTGAIR